MKSEKYNTYEHSGKLFYSACVNIYVGIQFHILETPSDVIQIRQDHNIPRQGELPSEVHFFRMTRLPI